MQRAERVLGVLRAARRCVADEPFGGEQRHLRVVGDSPAPTVDLVELDDPAGAVARADFGQRQELDRGPECVADRSAEQASAEPSRELDRDHGRRQGSTLS